MENIYTTVTLLTNLDNKEQESYSNVVSERIASGLNGTNGEQKIPQKDHLLVYFSLAIDLERIPPPSPCSYCGAPRQKEFLEFETTTEIFTLVADTPIPVYGCTSCGLKSFPASVAIALVEVAGKKAAEAGDRIGADSLKKEADMYKSASSKTT